MFEDFARLENTKQGQALLTYSMEDDGPSIRFRIADRRGLEVAIRLGPWPETDEGLDMAKAAFDAFDIPKEADELAALFERLTKD